MVKFKLQSRSAGGDDTALNSLEIICKSGTRLTSSRGPYGDWLGPTPECSDGFRSAQVQVEENQVRYVQNLVDHARVNQVARESAKVT